MTDISDPDMDTAIEWASLIRPPPSLPASMVSVEQRARLVDRVDSALIAGTFLGELTDEERTQRLKHVAEFGRSFLPDVSAEGDIKNLTLRMWAGCNSTSKDRRLFNT